MTARRRASLSTMTKRQGWLRPTDGDRQAISIRRSSVPSGRRIGAKAAHVAPPDEQLAQLAAKLVVEGDHQAAARKIAAAISSMAISASCS